MKPVHENNMHLTLKFLGEVDARHLAAVREAAQATAATRTRPGFVVRGLGTFPPSGAPRVIWAGVHERAGSDDENFGLAETVRILDEALVERLGSAGVQKERRAFSAHVTLGRVRVKPRFDRRAGSKGNEPKAEHEGDSSAEHRRDSSAEHKRGSTTRGTAWLARLDAFVRDHEDTVFGEEAVEAISVMRSRPGPGGPEYEELDRLEFQR